MICAETKSNTCRQSQSLQYSYITFQYWVGSKHSRSPHIKRSSRLVNDSKEKVINKARSRRSRARLASSSTLAIISQRKATLPLFPESRRRRLTERLAVIRGTMMTRFVPTPTFTLSRGFQGKQKEWTAKTQVPGFCHFFAHFLHSFRPFFTKTLDTVCVEKVTSARNVFKPDLERCKRESQEAQHSTAMWRPGQQCWQQVGQQEVVGQQGRGRARSNCGHPAGRTQPHCWCSSSSPGARLQRKHVQIEYILGKQIERNQIEYIRNKQTEYIREEELTSDDVDHGAGEVGVWRSTRVLPTIRVPHLQVVSFGQLGNYVLHCWRCKQNMLNNCCSYNRKVHFEVIRARFIC